MIDTRQRFRLIMNETSAARPNTQASPKAMRKRDVPALHLSARFGDLSDERIVFYAFMAF
jgi:hypothetical protein